MPTITQPSRSAERRSVAELTRAVLGTEMSLRELAARLDLDTGDKGGQPVDAGLWVGSVGYERFPDSKEFARRLKRAGVERLIDVRELPISRRRGYAKSALREAMEEIDIEYLHVRALGNPKRFRELYKAGKQVVGRRLYEEYLLSQQREALATLGDLLQEKRCALMCVEHDESSCHRQVILSSLRTEFRMALAVSRIQ